MSIKYCFKEEIHKAYELPKDLTGLLQSLPVVFITRLPQDFTLQYLDNDGDRVTITTDSEYQALINHEIKTENSCLKIWIVPISDTLTPISKKENHAPKSPSNGSFEVVSDGESPKRPEIIEFGSSESMVTPNDSLNQSKDEYVIEGIEPSEKKEPESKIVVSLIIPSSGKASPEKSLCEESECPQRLENTPEMSRRIAAQEISLSLDSKEEKEINNEEESDYGSFTKENKKANSSQSEEKELSFTSKDLEKSKESMKDCLTEKRRSEDKSFDNNYLDDFEDREEENKYEDSYESRYKESFDEESLESEKQKSHHYESQEERRLEAYLHDDDKGQEQVQEKWVSFSSEQNDRSYGSFGGADNNKDSEANVWTPVRPKTPESYSPQFDRKYFEANKEKLERYREEREQSKDNIEEELVRNLDELEKMFDGLRDPDVEEWKERYCRELQVKVRDSDADYRDDFEVRLSEIERARNETQEDDIKWTNFKGASMDIEQGRQFIEHENVQNDIELRELEISLLELTEAQKIASAIGSFRQPETMRRRWEKSPEKKKLTPPMYNRWMAKYEEPSFDKKSNLEKHEDAGYMHEIKGYSADEHETDEKEVEKKQDGDEAWPFLRQSKLWRRREAWNCGAKSEANSEREPEHEPEREELPHRHNENTFCMRCWTSPIYGPRYICLMCKDIEYCENCEKFASHEHPLLKLREWVDSEFIEDIREKVRTNINDDKEEEVENEIEQDEVSYKELEDLEEDQVSQELEHHPYILWGRGNQNCSQGESSLHSSANLPLETRTSGANDANSQLQGYGGVEDQLHGYGQRQESQESELSEPEYRFDYKEISSSPVTIRSNRKEWCLVYKTVCLRNCGRTAWNRCYLEPVGTVPGTSTEVAYVGAGDSVLVTLEIHGFFDARRHTSTWKLTHSDEDGNCVTMGYIVMEFDILESGFERYGQEEMYYDEEDMGRQIEFKESGRRGFGGFRNEEFEWFNEE